MSSTYDAEIYDLVTPRDLSGDVDWYRDLAVAADGPVLELGAGTGRVTIDLARAGIDTQHRRRVATLLADMQSFEAGRQFALVIAPFRVFLHNLTEQEQEACCARVSGT